MVKQISGTLTITIRKQDENYTIEANGIKGIKVDPHPAPQLQTLLSDQQMAGILKDLSIQTAPATTEAIQKLGKALYDSLFADRDLLLAFGKVQGSASSDSGARLRLQIEPAELAAFPWETLHDGKDWLSAQSTTPVVRKLALSENKKSLQKLQIRGALRILFVGASPEDLDKLEIEKTANELETLLAASIKKKQIAFSKLLNATLEELRQELLKDYHILYFAGHGSPEGIFLDDGEGDEIKKEGKVIGREREDKSLVSAETLAETLKGKQTRLVFLAACETSKASDKTSEGSRLLRGFAQELAEQSNLPAIVAMQYFISDMQALPLTTQFFAALAAGRPVDVAMAEARSGLMKNEKVNRDVFSPVLYLQAEDGALFPKAKNWPAISLGVAFLIATIIGGAFYRIATINEIQGLVKEAQTNLESNRMPEARIESIRAAKKIKQSFWRFSWPEELRNIVLNELVQTAYGGEELNRLEAKHGGTHDIAFSPDGKQIATSGRDGIVRLWDANGNPLLDTSGNPIVLNGNQNPVDSVAFSPDGKQIITGGKGGKVKLWDISGKLITDFKEHSSRVRKTTLVRKTTFSPDGKQVVTYSDDQTVRFWDISGNSLGEYEGFKGMATEADGELALFKNDGSIWFWNYSTKQLLPLLTNFLCKANECEGNSRFLNAVALSPDGQQIATSTSVDNKSGFLQLWDISGKLLASFEKQPIGINSVAFSPDGKYLVTSNDVKAVNGIRKINLWSIPHRYPYKLNSSTTNSGGRIFKPLSEFDLFGGLGGSAGSVFSPNSKQLIMVENQDTVRFWSTFDQQLVFDHPNSRVVNLAFNRDGKLVTVSYENPESGYTIRLWDLSGKLLVKFNPHVKKEPSVIFSPDGTHIILGEENGTMQVWDFVGNRLSATDTNPSPPLPNQDNFMLSSIALSPSGKQVATGGTDSMIRLWDIPGRLAKEFNSSQGDVGAIAFSHDGKQLATGGEYDTIKLWDISSNTLPEQFNAHQGGVLGVAFSPDGKIIASVGVDKTLRLWDLSGNQLVKLKTNQNRPIRVVFSHDGTQLVTGGEDGTARLWQIGELDKLLSINCDWVRGYLKNNTTLDKSDRHLCDGIGSRE